MIGRGFGLRDPRHIDNDFGIAVHCRSDIAPGRPSAKKLSLTR